jgi:exosortase
MSHSLQLESVSPEIAAVAQWRSGGLRVGVLVLLLIWLYSSILFHLAIQWCRDPNFSHGFFVPVFSLFVLWCDRARLLSLPRIPSSWGFVVITVSLCLLIVGELGAELFLARVSLIILLGGLTLTFFGANFLRAILFPLSILLLMIPIPAIVFSQITFPMQIFASKVAATVLPWLGVPVLREGNIINLPSMSLEVVEACSGIRSLLSLITLAIIYGYVMTGKNLVRATLALAAIPIAIITNSLRIVVTGLLVQYWNPDKAEGFFHIFSGWLVFLVSVAMLFLLQRALAWGEKREGPKS